MLTILWLAMQPPAPVPYKGFGYSLGMELALQEWYDNPLHAKLSGDPDAD